MGQSVSADVPQYGPRLLTGRHRLQPGGRQSVRWKFSNVAYFGLGAYTCGVLMASLGVPWWLTIVPAAVVGGTAGAVASIPALRGVRLFYLAIMTLAFGELMRWTYIRWEALTGGSMGMAVPPASLFGWPLASDRSRLTPFSSLPC